MFPETSPFPHPQHCHNPTAGDTEKPKGFSKRMPSPFPRSRELPFAVFLVSHCTISSLPAAPAELEISLSSSEAKKYPRENVAISKGEASGMAEPQVPASPAPPARALLGSDDTRPAWSRHEYFSGVC